MAYLCRAVVPTLVLAMLACGSLAPPLLAQLPADGNDRRAGTPLRFIRGDLAPVGLLPGATLRVCVPGLRARQGTPGIVWNIRLVGPDGEIGLTRSARVPAAGFRCVDVGFHELTGAGLEADSTGRVQVAARIVPADGDRSAVVVVGALPDGSFQILDQQTQAIVGRFGLKSYDATPP